MNRQQVIAEMDRLAAHTGIFGCALVDAASARVWHASAPACTGPAWEEAVEHWRLQAPNQLHFAGLGIRAAAVTYHANGVLAVFPCASDPEVLLVVHGRHRGVDWLALHCMVRTLGRLLHRPRALRMARRATPSTPSTLSQALLMTPGARSG